MATAPPRPGGVVVLVALLAGCFDAPPAPGPGETPASLIEFRVRVPAWTPREDAIVLHIGPDFLPMTRHADGSYRIRIDVSGRQEGDVLGYGYSRGGFLPFAETGYVRDIEPPRRFRVGAANIVEDEVTSWKWGGPPPDLTFVPDVDQSKPVARARFWGGPALVDFWSPSFPLQYNSTARHIKDTGYGWVILAPGWDVVSRDPPRLELVNTSGPSLSQDELRREIRALRAAGLEVMLTPHYCCPGPQVARDDAWWDAWYDTFESFVRSHAAICREEGVAAFVVGHGDFGLPLTPGSPSMAHARWQRVLDEAEACGVPVGYHLQSFPADGSAPEPWPSGSIDFFDRLDFVNVGLANGLLDSMKATQAELDAAAEEELRGADKLAERIGKPIVIGPISYASENASWRDKGPETFYTWGDPAENPATYDADAQARIYEAFLRAAARRSHVEGAFSFAYWYVDAPLTTDFSIRGKPAEAVFAAWVEALETSAAR